VHAFGFGIGTLATWEVLRRWLDADVPLTAGVTVVLALAGMGIGALNEVLEFFATKVQTDSNVGGYDNTGWDLVFNTIGCTVASLWVTTRERRRNATVDSATGDKGNATVDSATGDKGNATVEL
jgi:hypothetical protein